MKTYHVKCIKNKQTTIKGNSKSPFWSQANSLTDFCSPWDTEPIKKIEFKALHNSEKIYFQFKVDDNKNHIHPSEDKNDSINNSDRVELFFRSDASLNPYYCLEIDTSARIMDFKAYPNNNFDFNWYWPSKEIDVKSTINKSNFVVEIAISIQYLKELNLLKDNKIEIGIYRAKFNQQKNNTYKPTWITWVNPKTASPNFHTPSSFGLLTLENN